MDAFDPDDLDAWDGGPTPWVPDVAEPDAPTAGYPLSEGVLEGRPDPVPDSVLVAWAEEAAEALEADPDAWIGIGEAERNRAGAGWLTARLSRRGGLPDAELARVLQGLAEPAEAGVSVLARLDTDTGLDVAVAAQRLEGWALAQRLQVAATMWLTDVETAVEPEFHIEHGSGAVPGATDEDRVARRWNRPHPRDLAERALLAEVALALRMSQYTAADYLYAAKTLIVDGRLPRTWAALRAGLVDWPRLKIITDGTAALTDAQAGAVDERLAHVATHGTPGELRRALAAAVLAVDPRSADQRAETARADRAVTCRPLPDGMGLLSAVLPAEDARGIHDALTALARPATTIEGEQRTMDQLRADLLVDLVTRHPVFGTTTSTATAEPLAAPAPRPAITCTVSLDTLLGLDDNPAHLERYGPLAADVARRLAVDGTWRCAAVDDQHGTVLGLGRSTFTPCYRPGAALDRLTRARARRCEWPGCHRAVASTDADHTVPHPRGATCECNVTRLCRPHHLLKTHAGFTTAWTPYDRHVRALQVTTPTGRTHTAAPEPLTPRSMPPPTPPPF